MNIIDEIVKYKQPQRYSYRELEDMITGKTRGFAKALRSPNLDLICEYKPASPSEGRISDRLVEQVIPHYEAGGATALSILTEEHVFKSSLANLSLARELTDLPILRKDFIYYEYEVFEARALGADAVLLMWNVCPNLPKFIETAHELDLDVVLECHTQDELKKANRYDIAAVGINNRNFGDLSVDIKRTEQLVQYAPEGTLIISESGVHTPEDIEYLKQSTIDAVLVGSSLMGAEDIEAVTRALVDAGKRGRSEEDESKS